jgi:hypothetical protein
LGSNRWDDNTVQYTYAQGGGLPNTTETNRIQVIPADGTLDSWYMELSAAPGSGDTRVFTLLINGNPSALQLTFGASDTSKSTSATVAVSAGDIITLKSDYTGAAVERTYCAWGIGWVPDVKGEYILMGGTSIDPGAGLRYTVLNGYHTWSTTESLRRSMLNEVEARAIYAEVTVAPSVGTSRAYGLMDDGGLTALNATITAGNTDANASGTVSVADESEASIRTLVSGSPPSASSGWGLALYYAPTSLSHQEDLYAKFTVSINENLFSKFEVQHTSTKDLYAKFEVNDIFVQQLFAKLLVRNAGTGDLYADFFARNYEYKNLFSKAVIRHSFTLDQMSKFVVRKTGVFDLYSKALITRVGTAELFSEFIVSPHASTDLYAKLTVRQPESKDLFARFGVRLDGTPLNLYSKFIVTHAWTVASSTASTLTAEIFQRQTFYALGRHWYFYNKDDTIVLRTSLDGRTWSAFEDIFVHHFSDGFSMWLEDDSYFHWGGGENIAGINEGVFYQRFQIHADGSITPTSQRITVVPGSLTWAPNEPTIILDSEGYPWITYQYNNGSDDYRWYVIRGTKNDGTWSDGTETPEEMSDAHSYQWNGQMVPLHGRLIYFILSDANNQNVKGRIWNGSSWENWEDLGFTIAGTGYLSAVSVGSDVYIAYVQGNDIKFIKRTWGQGWGSPVTVYDASLQLPSITMTRGDVPGHFHIFWVPGTNSPIPDHISYSNSTDDGQNWSAPVDYIDESERGVQGLGGQLNAAYQQGADKIPFQYTRPGPPASGLYEARYSFLDGLPEYQTDDLFATFRLRTGAEDLYSRFKIEPHRNLFCEFTVRHEKYVRRKVFCQFTVRHAATQDLHAEFFLIRAVGPTDLAAEFFLNQYNLTSDLYNRFYIRAEIDPQYLDIKPDFPGEILPDPPTAPEMQTIRKPARRRRKNWLR